MKRYKKQRRLAKLEREAFARGEAWPADGVGGKRLWKWLTNRSNFLAVTIAIRKGWPVRATIVANMVRAARQVLADPEALPRLKLAASRLLIVALEAGYGAGATEES